MEWRFYMNTAPSPVDLQSFRKFAGKAVRVLETEIGIEGEPAPIVCHDPDPEDRTLCEVQAAAAEMKLNCYPYMPNQQIATNLDRTRLLVPIVSDGKGGWQVGPDFCIG